MPRGPSHDTPTAPRSPAELHNRLRWCLAQFRFPSPYRCSDPSLKPAWVAEDEAAPAAEADSKAVAVAEVATFEVDEDDDPDRSEEDGPAVLLSRVEQRLRKAEARRESRRRKDERQRA